MMSSMLAPASIFSKIAATGIRVPLNTHAPLILSGMLSTAGHCDQSRLAMFQLLASGYVKGVHPEKPPERSHRQQQESIVQLLLSASAGDGEKDRSTCTVQVPPPTSVRRRRPRWTNWRS